MKSSPWRDTASRLPDYLAVWLFMSASVLALHAALDAPVEGLRLSALLGLACVLSVLLRIGAIITGLQFLGPYVCGAVALLGWLAPQPIGAELSEVARIHLEVGARVIWLLVLRSFVLVTDGDMLFQAVPAVALLGIAATYTDAAIVPLLFLVFLGAAVFALSRAHIRAIGAGRLHRSVAAGPAYALTGAAVVAATAFLLAPLVGQVVGQVVPPRVFIGPGPRPVLVPTTPSTQVDIEIGLGGHASTDLQVLRVRSPRPLYLRERSFAVFTGTGWRAAVFNSEPAFPVTPGVFALTFGSRFEDSSFRERVEYEVEVVRGSHNVVYAAGEPVRVEIDLPSLDFAYHDAVLPNRYLRPGDRYECVSLVPPKRAIGEPAAKNYRYALRFLQLPVGRSPELRTLAQRVTARARSDYQRVTMLKDYIASTCAYTLRDPPLESRVDRVSEFLFERKQGYCDSFATALALLCREIGLPARVVRGYAPGDFDRNTDTYVVRDKHLHLWTEVLFENVGWVIFDATEGARNLDEEAGAMIGATDARTILRSPWWSLALDAAIAFLVIYILLALIVEQVRARHRVDVRTTIGRLYTRYLRALRRAGLPGRDPHVTPTEHLQRIAPYLPEPLRPIAEQLVESVNEGLYGKTDPESIVPLIRRLLDEWLRGTRELERSPS